MKDMEVQSRRAARRAAMPQVTAFVEQFADFGGTVVWAEENGHVYGKPPQDKEVFTVPANYYPMREVEKKGKK